MAFDQLLGQIFLNLSFFALSIRVTTKGGIMSNKTFVTKVFSRYILNISSIHFKYTFQVYIRNNPSDR